MKMINQNGALGRRSIIVRMFRLVKLMIKLILILIIRRLHAE